MLSVVITAWNEEKNLPRAVRSVADIAGEVVVVDTESSDNTVNVAKKLGCKVFHHQNTSIVEPVRNFSISKATGDWILLLDADEEVPPSLATKITQIIQEATVDYIRIPRKNLIFGRWIKTTHWWPDYVYRLFKKGHVTWKEEIHSIPFTKGQGLDLQATEDFSLIHHHYDSVSQFVDRLNRYTDTQAQELLTTSYKFRWQDLLTKPAEEFLTQYFARKGFTEGLHGFSLSMLQAFSSFVLYLKLWQLTGFAPHNITPTQLRQAAKSVKKDALWWYFQTKIDASSSLARPFWKLVRRAMLIAQSL